MNKITRKFYPVERLPADLQLGLPKGGWVHVELDPNVNETPTAKVASLVGSGRNVHGDVSDVLDGISAMRTDR
jgi:hypothetical protein